MVTRPQAEHIDALERPNTGSVYGGGSTRLKQKETEELCVEHFL